MRRNIINVLIFRKRLLATKLWVSMLIVATCYLFVLLKSHGNMTIFQDLKQTRNHKASSYSPLSRLNIISDIYNLNLKKKCQFYFNETYRLNPKWTHDQTTFLYNIDAIDNTLALLSIERLRMFDTCFMKSTFSVEDIITNNDPQDFTRRMFPFINNFEHLIDLWPRIYDLNNKQTLDIFFEPNNSLTFWENWIGFSKGKGIAIALGESHLDTFRRLLLVLDYLGNTDPIQIVTKGNELSSYFIDEIFKFLNNGKIRQKVYLIDCSQTLNVKYIEEHLPYFLNKWLAAIFNTFEEFILLDADTIPFVSLRSLFELEGYKKTGIFFYKDRNIPQEKTFDYCIELFNEFKPSNEEIQFMNYTLNLKDDEIDLSESEYVYQRFFQKKILHNLDSGLVIVNKKKKLSSLIMSFMMNLNAKIQRCVYGDKELFWLGQFFSNENYAFSPIEGSIIGFIKEPVSINNQNSTVEFKICGTQMAHSDENDNLIWTNGGLRMCKNPLMADSDFEQNPEYFKSKFGSIDALKSYYKKPLKINGLIIPNITVQPWERELECKEYSYCATVTSHSDNISGKLVKFKPSVLRHINEISLIWNLDL